MGAQSKPTRYEVTKTYPTRGPLQQYRVATATSFACFRCGRTKTSKLVTVFRGDWAHERPAGLPRRRSAWCARSGP
jgi:hypothetical protein